MTRKPPDEQNREAFQPEGEATDMPDRQLEDSHETQDHLDATDYPSRPETMALCHGCRQPIPPNHRACVSCLSNRIEPLDTTSRPADDSREICELVVVAVVGAVDYLGVAKATAACTLLRVADDNRIDACQLIYDAERPLATTLKDLWGDLPDVTKLNTASGQRLLSHTTKQRTGSSVDGSAASLYDETGESIDADQLSTIQTRASEPVWLVPAIGMQSVSADEEAESIPVKRTQQRLQCNRCDEETIHTFQGRQSDPRREGSGTPIWGCDVCHTPQYGPELSD